MKTNTSLFIISTLLFANLMHSQGGTFDSSFGTNGKVITTVGSNLRDLVLQPDGKIVAVGDMNPAGPSDQFVIARYLPDGTLDPDFGTNGSLKTLYGAKCGASAAVLQADGKILSIGYTSATTGNSGHRDAMIIRYTADGALDATFGVEGIKILSFQANGSGSSIYVQPDGKIVISGMLESKFMTARLLQNGDLDISFNTVGYANYSVFNRYYSAETVKVLNDGKILVAGRGYDKFVVLKYNADGTPDTSFGIEGVLEPAGITATPAIIRNMLTFDNGDFIVIGGAMYNDKYNGVMAKFNANGSLATSFGNNGVIITDVGTGKSTHGIDVVTFENKIFAGYSAGPTSNYDFMLTAYSMDGVVDTTFGDQGSIQFYFDVATVHDYLDSVIMQPDGKIVMGGKSATGGFSMARIASGILGLEDFTTNTTFGVYPNPVIANSQLITNLSGNGRYSLDIYDMQGKHVADLGEKDLASGENQIALALPELSQGIYFLRIAASGKEVKSIKIVY